jgi:hypothetical protein
VNSFWNCITILGLVLLLIFSAWFKILIGIAICSLLLGVSMCLLVEAFFKEAYRDPTREEIEQSRKQNY